MKLKQPTEDKEQEGLINWFRLKFPGILIFHIPNGEQRALSVGIRLKKQGVVAGIPDLFIPTWKLWIEMKRKEGGVVSENQRKIMEYLTRVGYTCVVAHGSEDASRQLLNFLKEREKK